MTLESHEYQDLAQRGYRFALSLTHDAESAEELLQDAWFSLLKRGGPWDRGYVFATIRNRFIDGYRRTAARGMESLDGESAAELADESGDESEVNEPLEIVNGNLGAALAGLSAEERGVLYLSGVERCSAQVIADMLHWPRSTVLGVARRAKLKLRQALNGVSSRA